MNTHTDHHRPTRAFQQHLATASRRDSAIQCTLESIEYFAILAVQAYEHHLTMPDDVIRSHAEKIVNACEAIRHPKGSK